MEVPYQCPQYAPIFSCGKWEMSPVTSIPTEGNSVLDYPAGMPVRIQHTADEC